MWPFKKKLRVANEADKRHTPILDLVEPLVQWFYLVGGVNFVTIDLHGKDGQKFTVTVQKSIGITPAQRINELEVYAGLEPGQPIPSRPANY